jgi:type II secretory pathway pseudopilin PulG
MSAARPSDGAQRQRGFSYLAVLFLVALTAAGLATLGQAWRTAAQRERERELAFRGGEIARAIASYQRAGAVEPAPYPASLRDLLEDVRGPRVRRHLRRLYVDPFTGQADWVLVPDPVNPSRFRAVHSRADTALLRRTAPDGQAISKASDWVFDPLAAAPGRALPASAPAGPSLPGSPAAPAPSPVTPTSPGAPPSPVPTGRPTPD